MTVTAPLDMGAGQQRYVVAYTLKQGIERQPDILNAQKGMFRTNSVRVVSFHFSVSVHIELECRSFYWSFDSH